MHGLYTWLRENSLIGQVIVCRFRYARHLKRLRGKPAGEKIRVLFIVSEIAKWKEQKIYEAMAASDDFEPIVGLSAWNRQALCSAEELDCVHKECLR